MNGDEHDDEQWTDHARELFRDAASKFIEAIHTHSTALLAMSGRASDAAVFDGGNKLAKAAAAYADAQFELTGIFPPLGLGQDDEDDTEQDSEDHLADPAARVSVFHRADYRVTDAEAVMRAGMHAYQRAWPEDTEDDAASDVSHLGRALYQIQHADGLASVGNTPGLEPAGATTWIVEAVDLLDEGGSQRDNPFADDAGLRQRLLHFSEDVFG